MKRGVVCTAPRALPRTCKPNRTEQFIASSTLFADMQSGDILKRVGIRHLLFSTGASQKGDNKYWNRHRTSFFAGKLEHSRGVLLFTAYVIMALYGYEFIVMFTNFKDVTTYRRELMPNIIFYRWEFCPRFPRTLSLSSCSLKMFMYRHLIFLVVLSPHFVE
jgi:hypothetical protein